MKINLTDFNMHFRDGSVLKMEVCKKQSEAILRPDKLDANTASTAEAIFGFFKDGEKSMYFEIPDLGCFGNKGTTIIGK